MVKNIFSTLPSTARHSWEKARTRKTAPKRTLVYQEESPIAGVYLLRHGAVKLFIQLPNGKNQICEILGPENFLNLSAVFYGTHHDCSCETLVESYLEYLDIDAFFVFLANYPPVMPQLTAHLADQVTDLRRRLANLGGMTSRERLATCLIWLTEKYGRPTTAGIEITLPLSRTDIAEFTGVTTETAIRQLASLKDEGIIASRQQKLLILDRERLAARIEGPT